MRKSDGAIAKLVNRLLGNPLPKEYFPDAGEYEMEIRQIKRIAEFCFVLLIILTALWHFGGNFLADSPEPEWWTREIEPWLLSLFF